MKEIIHMFILQPSFGYFIRSPEEREPVALIRKSDLSRSDLEKEMARDPFSGNRLNERIFSNSFLTYKLIGCVIMFLMSGNV